MLFFASQHILVASRQVLPTMSGAKRVGGKSGATAKKAKTTSLGKETLFEAHFCLMTRFWYLARSKSMVGNVDRILGIRFHVFVALLSFAA